MALSALVHDVSSQDEFRAALYTAAFMIHFLLQEQQSRAGRRGDALDDRLFPAPLFEQRALERGRLKEPVLLQELVAGWSRQSAK